MQGQLVFAEVNAVLFLELISQIVDHDKVKILTTKEGVAVGGLHFKYAIADFARDMLAVSDNLQRALSAVSDEHRKGNPEMAQLLEGVELTQRELQGHFDKHGIREVNPLGEKMDPNLHQAVVQIDDPEAAQGTVVQVMQVGYVIQDRLLRAAMVGVAKGAPAAPKAADDDGQNVDTQA